MTTLVRAVCTAGLFAVIALAQLNRGSITGTVTDNSGAVVPNVYVFEQALFSDPAPLTLGTSARYGQARNFARRNEDIGLQKNMKLSEKFRFQLRAEFLNALNRGTLGGIQTTVTSPQFGQVTSISGNRQIQLGTRLDF